jgi:Tol biopolymer transport system component
MSSSARHMTPPSRSRIRPIAPPLALFLAIATGSLLSAPALATAAKTRRVSVSSTGAEANGSSNSPFVSVDGRFVAFNSTASNLVGGDANGLSDVFVRDRQTGKTRRVSVSSAGTEGDAGSYGGLVSADGRFVAFWSDASNLVGADSNGVADIFIRDRQAGTTRRISVSSAGVESDGVSYPESISADGRFVAFESDAANLVGGDANDATDVFVRDRQNGTTKRVSVSSTGAEGDGDSYSASISTDGRFVAFTSSAANLIGSDTNAVTDVFVRDRQNGTTKRVSVSSAGTEGNEDSHSASISSDGRFVAFGSGASSLVGNDTNAVQDVFVRDRRNGTTRRVSVSSAGLEGNANSTSPSISANGRFVGFYSYATTLVGADTNGLVDVFVRDRGAGTTRRASVSSAGVEGDANSFGPSISADGRFVAFYSAASTLVGGDNSGFMDVFVRGPLH